MKYLKAAYILKHAKFNDKKSLKVFTSATFNPLEINLRAEAALREIDLNIELSSFGALFQSLVQDKKATNFEVLVFFPWDIFPFLDWRSGGGEFTQFSDDLIDTHISNFVSAVNQRKLDYIIYCDVPYLKCTLNREDENKIKKIVDIAGREISDTVLPSSVFSLKNYLKTGFPFDAESLGSVAESFIKPFIEVPPVSKKVIITDLDNTFWKGILGEDGVQNLEYSPEGGGYVHFIYQRMLKRLKNSGVLVAAVSKNDLDLVEIVFSQIKFEFNRQDFVRIDASYDPKLIWINKLSQSLNLPLDSFVFIDDNVVEIEQVKVALPDVTCLLFPNSEKGFINFIDSFVNLFEIRNTTLEDYKRTEMYRSRENFRETMPNFSSLNIDDFLKSQKMKLICFDRSHANFIRGLQLINKTNQFNLNGLRISDDKFNKIISEGGMLITGELSDLSGGHGEIIAMLIRKDGQILSYVMSCRVFDRKLEYLFIIKVLKLWKHNLIFEFVPTERNKPFNMYISSISECLRGGFLERELFQKSYSHLKLLIKSSISQENLGE